MSWCLLRLMRRCFLGRWLCLPVSERFRLVWKCHLFDCSTTKAWTAIDRLSNIWKADLTNKMKRSFFLTEFLLWNDEKLSSFVKIAFLLWVCISMGAGVSICVSEVLVGGFSSLVGGCIFFRTLIRFLGFFIWIWSSEKDIDTRLTKACTAINRLSIIWKADLTYKMKRSFFLTAVVSILLYGCTTWTLTKRLKKLDSNYTRMLRVILNKSWR